MSRFTLEEFQDLVERSLPPEEGYQGGYEAPNVGMAPLADVLASLPRVKRPAAPWWTFGWEAIAGATALQFSLGRGHAPAAAFGTAQGAVGYFSEDYVGPKRGRV